MTYWRARRGVGYDLRLADKYHLYAECVAAHGAQVRVMMAVRAPEDEGQVCKSCLRRAEADRRARA